MNYYLKHASLLNKIKRKIIQYLIYVLFIYLTK